MESGGGNYQKALQYSTQHQNNYHHQHQHQHYFVHHLVKSMFLSAVLALAFIVLYHSADRLELLSTSIYNKFLPSDGFSSSELYELNRVLQKAATRKKTVIMTALNEAWTAKDSIFDLFIESFKIGNQTKGLLKHLLVIALDQKAYARCLKSKLHCYSLRTDGIDFSGEAYFMSTDYLKMMWRRIQFLTKVLDMGYDFLFSDADIMWFRDPFPHFYPDADFQIACDYFRGNPSDIDNAPNGGFTYVKSNNKTRQFYRFWHDSRILYPQYHDQDVLNRIKHDPCIQQMGLKIKFFDTAYIGGFCEPSRDLNKVCTMHANCCAGLENKVHDLKIMLEDWRKYMKLSESDRSGHSWTVPQLCGLSSFGRRKSTNKTSEGT